MRRHLSSCEFIVHANQVRGKGRPRATMKAGHINVYASSEDVAWERRIRDAYLATGGADMSSFADEVTLDIEVNRKLPSSRPKKVSEEPDTSRPDIDNVCKSVLDALNRVAWRDDSQVTEITAAKMPRTRRDDELLIVRIDYYVNVGER